MAPADLAALREEEPDAHLLDVRTRAEHAAGTVDDADLLSAGKVLFQPGDLPANDAGRLITFCQSGLRNSVAAAALRRAGYDVVELEGSYAGWSQWAAAQHDLQTTGEHAMCRATTCSTCGKTTWAGCGQHVDQVMQDVRPTDRCPGHAKAAPEKGFFARLLGR